MNRRGLVASTLALSVIPRGPAAAQGDSSAEAEAVKRRIIDWYRAFANPRVDRAYYSGFMTGDYLLLENGELLDKAADIALLGSLPADLVRTDRFDFRRVTVDGDRADLVYFLEADMNDAANGPRHRRWLESAVMRREGGEWRCALLHSTRVQAAATEVSAADRAAIEAVVTPFDRSATAFADVDWENAFGRRRQGYAAMSAFLTERVAPTLTDMRVQLREIRLTPVTLDVVVADKYLTLSGQTDGPGGAVLPDRNIRQTYVLRRAGSGWVVVAERIGDLRARLTASAPAAADAWP